MTFLLIEPVWNRNKVSAGGGGVPPVLLIEPVWNRNEELETDDQLRAPFNRTSMESKRK